MSLKQTPAERSLHGRMAAHISWAKTKDPKARTAPGRAAADKRFEDLADPDGTLPEAERLRIAKHLRSAYFAELAKKSAAARRSRKVS